MLVQKLMCTVILRHRELSVKGQKVLPSAEDELEKFLV